jgi:hypothetical protein
MKPRLFAAVLVGAITSVPILGIALNAQISSQAFTIDSIKGAVAKSLTSFGISVNPSQVWVGNEGYLFLGPSYENTLINGVVAATPEDTRKSQSRLYAMNKNFTSIREDTGVDSYLLIGPDKPSVAEDYVPGIFRATETSRISLNTRTLSTSASVANPITEISMSTLPTYYKTDSHWNLNGAYLGYRKLMSVLQESRVTDAIKMVQLNESDFKVTQHPGGDLSAFLYSRDQFTDIEVSPRQKLTGRLVKVGSQEATVETWSLMPTLYQPPGDPLVYENQSSLNRQSVLWVGDSFSTSMTSYMFSSFRQIVFLHSANMADLNSVKSLISEHNVDLVVFTIVERSLMSDTLPIFSLVVEKQADSVD